MPPAPSEHMATENRRFPLSMFVYDHTTGIVCLAIPKNGCSTIKRWMLQRLDEGVLQDASADLHRVCRDRFALTNLLPEEASWLVNNRFVMTFMRDPLSRVVSAYVDKFVGPRPHELVEGAIDAIDDVARQSGVDVEHDTVIHRPDAGGGLELSACSSVDYERSLTFREFVGYLERTPDECMDFHWRPQAGFLGGYRFDLIAQVDALTDILRAISARLDIAAPGKSRVNATLYTDDIVETNVADIPGGVLRKRWIRPRAGELMTPELRERLLARYAADQTLYENASRELGLGHVERLLQVQAQVRGADRGGSNTEHDANIAAPA